MSPAPSPLPSPASQQQCHPPAPAGPEAVAPLPAASVSWCRLGEQPAQLASHPPRPLDVRENVSQVSPRAQVLILFPAGPFLICLPQPSNLYLFHIKRSPFLPFLFPISLVTTSQSLVPLSPFQLYDHTSSYFCLALLPQLPTTPVPCFTSPPGPCPSTGLTLLT